MKELFKQTIASIKNNVKRILCVFSIHRWEYFQREMKCFGAGKIEWVNFAHRKCKICRLEMYRDKLPPAVYEYQHWHYVKKLK